MKNLSTFVKRLRDIMRNDSGVSGDAQRIEQISWILFLKVYSEKEDEWELMDNGYESIIPADYRWSAWAHNADGRAKTGDELLTFVDTKLFPALKSLQVDAGTPRRQAVVQSVFEEVHNFMKDGVLLRQVIDTIDELDLTDYDESHAFGDIYESILKELQSAGSAGEFYTPRALTDFMAKMIQPKLGERMADFACGTGGFITSWLGELSRQVKTTEDERAVQSSVYGMEKKQFPYILCVTNMLLHGQDNPAVFHGNSLDHDLLDYTERDAFDVVLMNPPYGGNEKTDIKSRFPADLASSETADLFMNVIMRRLKKNGRCAVILPDGFLFGADGAKLAIKKKLLDEYNLHTVIRLPGSVFAPYTSITTNILFFNRDERGTSETWFYRLDMPEGYKHFSKTRPMKLEHFNPVVDWWGARRELEDGSGAPKAKRYTKDELVERSYNLDLCGFPHEEDEILPPDELIARYKEEREELTKKIYGILDRVQDMLGGDVLPRERQNSTPCGGAT